MFENKVSIRGTEVRCFEKIPIDDIVVLNPRKRNEKQFEENIRSIKEVGLQQPVVVTKRMYAKTKKYGLVCGEGRLHALKNMGKTHITAEIIDVDEGTALILSLVENIARVRPSSIEFARSIVTMHKSGMTLEELSKITGRTKSDISDYIRLMKCGEERLIKGVEEGIFGISFAKEVAKSNDANIQQLILDALDEKIISTGNFQVVTKLLESRKKDGTSKPIEDVKEIKHCLENESRMLQLECNQVKRKENRVTRLLIILDELKKDKTFLDLMKKAGISLEVELQGKYSRT